MARVAPEDPYTGLADSDRLAKAFPDLDVLDATIPSAAEMTEMALKVEDGDMRCSPPALLSVLRQVAEQRGLSLPLADLRQHAQPVLRTTRGEAGGELRATRQLRFH